VVEAVRLLWKLTEDITVQLALVHRGAELDIVQRDGRRRDEFTRQLLSGTLSGADLTRYAAAYGLRLGERYCAVRARPAGDGGLSDLRRAIETTGATDGQQCFVGIMDGEVAGVVATTPVAPGLDAVIALGPPVHLESMASSYAAASRVLDVSRRFGMAGVFSLVDLATRAVVVDESDLGDLLVERYLEPLSGVADFRPVIEETLRVYLARGLSLKSAARQLGVHPNSLRYRLKRFEELTGTRLNDTEILFRVWWALERSA